MGSRLPRSRAGVCDEQAHGRAGEEWLSHPHDNLPEFMHRRATKARAALPL
ncbi:MAG: hypothetical protein AMXMBFR56_43070 [Polyangiaceae bacterium]